MNNFFSIRQRTHITYDEVAEQFCKGNSMQQRILLETLAQEIEACMGKGGRWDMQCYSIANCTHWLPLNKDRLIHQLEVLLEHLKESKKND